MLLLCCWLLAWRPAAACCGRELSDEQPVERFVTWRTWWLLLGGAVTFSSGWMGRSFARGEHVSPDRRAPASSSAAGAAACTDPLAMEANRNLATEVHDYQQRYLAEATARLELEQGAHAQATAMPDTFRVGKDEWSRLAREGTLRIRLPCARWDGPMRSELRGENGGTSRATVRHVNLRGRAELAGLMAEEIDALPEVYSRAQKRTWDAIASACNAEDDFRAEEKDLEPDDVASRVRLCAAFVHLSEDSTQRAIRRVAELRAAGATIVATRGATERVLFGLTEASDRLVEELVRTYGREKARRLLDYDIACVDDSLYVAGRRP